jgi:hypothetical protein
MFVALRKILLPFLLAFLAPGFIAPVFAAGEIRRAPAPEWVTERPIPQPRDARARQVENGVYYLLLDTQVMPHAAGDTFNYRMAFQVMGREGLEQAGRLDIEFEPTFEDVVLHHVRILRDGVELDRLEGAEIQELRRETSLDSGIIDGRRTAHVEITDVRIGDIVDAAYSWERTHLLWPGHFFGYVPVHWSGPLETSHYRVHWPAERPLTIRNLGTDVAPAQSEANGLAL